MSLCKKNSIFKFRIWIRKLCWSQRTLNALLFYLRRRTCTCVSSHPCMHCEARSENLTRTSSTRGSGVTHIRGQQGARVEETEPEAKSAEEGLGDRGRDRREDGNMVHVSKDLCDLNQSDQSGSAGTCPLFCQYSRFWSITGTLNRADLLKYQIYSRSL